MKATVDVCKIESNMADRKYKYPSLKELYNYLFHKDFDNMHNSLYDVRATAECFWELSQRGIIKYCKNSPIQLNFVSENKYCCQCGGLLESSYCSFPKWDGNLHCNVKIVVCFMWQAIERMMNCIFRSVVMCYIYYVYT